ncbi:TIR domain-containing protein [Corallococcus exercitus]|uniref:TIR domain-containing protein n=1 Tax=Corallococcus exercitus TaxID=2316736 RepID=A0A7Y4KK17_9BACT|nr:TIR domain-containing protein [Corallococcus exercitus]
MSLRIAQSDKYAGDGWWRWAVWLEGTQEELSQVESVTYFLHPTFPTPVRKVQTRRTNFRLQLKGYGGFTLKARVDFRDKKSRMLRHELRLELPKEPHKLGMPRSDSAMEAEQPAQSRERPQVFLSYSVADAKVADLVKQTLQTRGVTAVDASSSLEPGSSLRETISQALLSSDAMVTIHSDASNRWVDAEVATARARDIPVISVVLGDNGVKHRDSASTKAIHFSHSPGRGEVEAKLSGMLPDFLKK